MGAELLGDDFKVYWDQAGSYASPTWGSPQTSIGDAGIDPANEQVEIPKRIAFKAYKKGRGDWSLSFTSNIDDTNTFHKALLAAIAAGTRLHLAIAAGAIATEPYWHAWWMLTGPVDAALDSAASIEVEGKPHHDMGASDTEIPAYVAN